MHNTPYISARWTSFEVRSSLLKVSLPISIIVALAVTLMDSRLLFLSVMGLLVLAVFLARFDLGVCAFVVLVPLTIHSPVELHHMISYSLSGMLVLSWLIRKLIQGQTFASLDRGILMFMVFYTLWGFVSSLHSDYPSTGLFVTLRQLLFFAIFYILYDWMRSKKEIGLTVNAMITMGVIASLPALAQLLSSGLANVFRLGNPMRFAGVYTGVNALAMHLSFILVLALSKFLYADLPRRRWFSLAWILIIASALFFTFSRSGWLLAVVGVTIVLFRFKGGRMLLLTVLILLTLFLLLSPQIKEFLAMITRLEAGVTNRDILWQGAIKMIKENPIFGVGPGGFKHFIADCAPRYPWRWPVVRFGGITGGDSHNFFLSRAAETGIVGLVLILWFFVNYFKAYSRGTQKAKALKLEHVSFGAAAVVIGALARGFFEGKGIVGSGGGGFELFFWLMVAFTLKVSQLPDNKPNTGICSSLP